MKRLACLLVLIFSTIVHAETYSWTDSSGGMHFTENIDSVPAKYRKKAIFSAREGITSTASREELEEQYRASANRQGQYILEQQKIRQQAQEEKTRKLVEEQRNLVEERRRQADENARINREQQLARERNARTAELEALREEREDDMRRMRNEISHQQTEQQRMRDEMNMQRQQMEFDKIWGRK